MGIWAVNYIRFFFYWMNLNSEYTLTCFFFCWFSFFVFALHMAKNNTFSCSFIAAVECKSVVVCFVGLWPVCVRHLLSVINLWPAQAYQIYVLYHDYDYDYNYQWFAVCLFVCLANARHRILFVSICNKKKVYVIFFC